MAPQSVARSESIAAFIPALELLITEAMDEWKIPGLAVAVVQTGEVAPVGHIALNHHELHPDKWLRRGQYPDASIQAIRQEVLRRQSVAPLPRASATVIASTTKSSPTLGRLTLSIA